MRGGAHGNLAGYSFDGGLTWARSAPRFSRCAGGAGLGNAGDYQRATDPWLSFGPNGRLHAIPLSFDNSTARNAILAAFSDNGGASRSAPRIVRFDNLDSQGRVAVSYYDFRNDRPRDAELSTDFWVTHSHDGGRTFPDENRLIATPFDMRTAPDAGGYFVGDYTGLDHAGSVFHPAWVSANTGNLTNRTDVFHRSAQSRSKTAVAAT